MARTRSRRRTGRTRRRRKSTFSDHLMVAGIVGGGLFLLLHQICTVPSGPALVLGVLAFGFSLGTSARTVVRLRSPIVRGRRR